MLIMGCSRGAEVATLFQGDPGIRDIPPGIELHRIVDAAPPSRFSRMEYESWFRDELSKKERLSYRSSVILKERNHQLAVTQTDYFMLQPDGSVLKQSADADVGLPGIVSFVHLTTKLQSPREIRFRRAVRRFEGISGRLFPLEEGNLLAFDMVCAYQSSRGSSNSAVHELRWSYRYHVKDVYEGYALPGRAVPGKVFVIDRQEVDPDGAVDNTVLHLSEALGVVLKTVGWGVNYIQETRLAKVQE